MRAELDSAVRHFQNLIARNVISRSFAFGGGLSGYFPDDRRNDEDGSLYTELSQHRESICVVVLPAIIKCYRQTVFRENTMLLEVLNQLGGCVENKARLLQVGHLHGKPAR